MVPTPLHVMWKDKNPIILNLSTGMGQAAAVALAQVLALDLAPAPTWAWAWKQGCHLPQATVCRISNALLILTFLFSFKIVEVISRIF